LPDKIAISNSWFPRLSNDLDRVFSFLAEKGFTLVELNYRVHPIVLPRMSELLKKYGIQPISLHNLCSAYPVPFDPDDPYSDQLASLDEDKRRLSVEHLISTARTARVLGARAVVVHAGFDNRTKFDPRYKRILEAMGSNRNDESIRELAAQLYRERKDSVKPHLEQLIRSLKEVCPQFPDILFGLETRYHLHSIPDIEEVGLIIEEVGCDNLGYWHDYGHAQVQENLGLYPHEEWFRRYSDRLVGIHIHAVKRPFQDHMPLGKGELDIEMLKRYLKPGVIKVLEVAGEFSSPEELLKMGRILEGTLG